MEPISLVFQSLAEAPRLRILALLLEEPELCVCDLMAALQLPQSTVSRHLAHLKNAGWLRDRREAMWTYYALAQPLGPLQQSLLPLLRHFLREEPLARADRVHLSGIRQTRSCS